MTDAQPQSLPDPAPNAKPQKPEESSFFSFLIKLFLIIFVVRSFVFAPFSIPSESMLPRLLTGDYLIVSKFSYGYSTHSLWLPKAARELLGERPSYATTPVKGSRLFGSLPDRGDVAVFKAPPTHDVDYIKRVIGLPGDRVQVQGGVLIINGRVVAKKRIEDFVVPVSPNTPCIAPVFEQRGSDGTAACHYPQFAETLPEGKQVKVLDLRDAIQLSDGGVAADYTETYVVPEGQLFVMGDNRDGSADSRFPAREGAGVGFVPVENLVGKAKFIIFSTDGAAEWIKPWTWFTAARWDRIGTGL